MAALVCLRALGLATSSLSCVSCQSAALTPVSLFGAEQSQHAGHTDLTVTSQSTSSSSSSSSLLRVNCQLAASTSATPTSVSSLQPLFDSAQSQHAGHTELTVASSQSSSAALSCDYSSLLASTTSSLTSSQLVDRATDCLSHKRIKLSPPTDTAASNQTTENNVSSVAEVVHRAR